MNRFVSMYLRSTLALFALACSSDSVTRPVDERSLVLAYTNESSVSCNLVLASLDGRVVRFRTSVALGSRGRRMDRDSRPMSREARPHRPPPGSLSRMARSRPKSQEASASPTPIGRPMERDSPPCSWDRVT